MTEELQTEFRVGALYAIWDEANRIIGEFVGWYQGLPEFRPLIWDGPDAEPCRTICAGPRAWVQAITDQAEQSPTR